MDSPSHNYIIYLFCFISINCFFKYSVLKFCCFQLVVRLKSTNAMLCFSQKANFRVVPMVMDPQYTLYINESILLKY